LTIGADGNINTAVLASITADRFDLRPLVDPMIEGINNALADLGEMVRDEVQRALLDKRIKRPVRSGSGS
jgi:hypothetical protein